MAAALAAAALPAAPAAAQGPGGVAAPAPAPVQPVVTASGGGLSVYARPDALLGRVARFRGTASAGAAGRLVRIERLDSETQRWTKVAGARVAAGGAFLARWRTDHIGRFAIRARLRDASSPLAVTVYKPALATWYGPGFFGNQTACGQALTPDLQGVAHRTLPCGTPVALTYDGRSIVVPVIDRGPFGVVGADWDLTQAAAQTLGVTQTVQVGAVRLRPQPAPPM